MDQQIDAIIDEAINEAIGTSSKKWALVLVALVVGVMGALWLVGRARSTAPAFPTRDVDST